MGLTSWNGPIQNSGQGCAIFDLPKPPNGWTLRNWSCLFY